MEKVLGYLDSATNGHVMEAVIAVAILLLIHLLVTVILTVTAKRKGHKELGYFFLCLFTFFIGYVITASLTDLRLKSEINHLYSLLENESEEYSSGLVAQTKDTRGAQGTTAYMPQNPNDAADKQTKAAQKLAEYWNNSEKTAKKK